MNSVIQEIDKLRGGSPINIIESQSDRYTILCREPDRTKTAYCFSVPVRNRNTGSIVNLQFQYNSNENTFVGSEARISLASDKISIRNPYGQCDINFRARIVKKTNDTIYFKSENCCMEVHPTLNGLMMIMDCNFDKCKSELSFCLNSPYALTRANEKYFSFMRNKYTPFITVSCIGMLNANGKVTAPCEIHNQKRSDTEYSLMFSTASKAKGRIAFEINMQEDKLFKDTTVESRHPKLNNAFGGTAFLGKSKAFGEQWLYSRLEVSGIPQLQGKRITNIYLHIPRLGQYRPQLTVNRIVARFCSFGSNWENKIALSDPIAQSSVSDGYYHFNLTSFFDGFKEPSKNYVIREAADHTAVIPTGDNFYAPQILEVKFH